MSEIIEVTSVEEFDTIIKDNSEVVLKFWATWCGPCRQFAPHFEIVAENNVETYISIDVDVVPEVPARYGVRGIPTVLAFKDGDVVGSPTERTALPLSRTISELYDHKEK